MCIRDRVSTQSTWGVVPRICGIVVEFINHSVNYMQGIHDNDGLMFIQLDRFLYEVYKAFEDFVSSSPSPTILQQAQTMQNSFYIHNAAKYFSKYLENASKCRYSKTFESIFYFDQIKYKCEENIHESLNEKIELFVQMLGDVKWMPSAPNSQHHDCMEDLVNYMQSTLYAMKIILPDYTRTLAYLTFKHINNLIFDVLLQKVKNFNIAALYNLELDLIYMFNCAGNFFKEYENLMDCLRELRQFLDMFLIGHPNEYVDLKIRGQKYYHLDPRKMIPILDKYKKTVINKLPVVRRREVDAVLKKLKQEVASKGGNINYQIQGVIS
eukprot:TRINITY_DN2002_c0_g1_i6.p1 TRINITY_DN2002_c0_g1~~TRINITY_DN2002_c0_g1_i6.p1  ORF type:complete len:325 (-),score=68.23 TRINITY_DN2002_c0_g1_i6:139-1113(-)